MAKDRKPTEDKRKFSWNPLIRIEDDGHALELARDGGVACAGLLAFSYILMVGFIFFTGKSLWGGEGDSLALWVNVTAIAIAAFLGWRIWRRQPLWAIWIVFGWIILETASKVWMAVGGGITPSPFSFFVNVIALIAGIQAIRGGLVLSANRSRARKAAVKAGFDL